MSSRRCRWLAAGLLIARAAVAPAARAEGPAAPAGPLAVSVSLEPAEIRIGDRARLTVTVDHPAAGSLDLPALEQGKAVVVLDQERRAPEARPDGSERTTFAVVLTSFEVGERPVGSGNVRFTDREGRSLEQPLPAAALRTRSLLGSQETPLRAAKGIVRWPPPRRRWALPAAALLLAVAAALVAARRMRAVRRPRPRSVPPSPSPREMALGALAVLRRGEALRDGQAEPLYRQLSLIVRRYLEDRYGLQAPERTTEEFIREARGSGLVAPEHQELIRAFLEQCDLVKFARLRPLPETMARALDAAERLVRETGEAPGR